jgi:hypothetical protein
VARAVPYQHHDPSTDGLQGLHGDFVFKTLKSKPLRGLDGGVAFLLGASAI